MIARLALAVLRWYPRRWRRRYEDEVRAHIDDHGATARDLLDLAWGAARERWRGPNGPDPGERPFAAMWWRGVTGVLRRIVVGSSLGAVAYGAGWTIGTVTGPPPDTFVLWLLPLGLAGFGFVCLRAIYDAYKVTKLLPALPPPKPSGFPQRIMWGVAAIFVLSMVVIGTTHEPVPWQMFFRCWWLMVYPVFDVTFDRSGRHRRIDEASRRYFVARAALKRARIELNRLQSISMPSTHPDVERQLDTIDRRETEMESALAVLRDPDFHEAVEI